MMNKNLGRTLSRSELRGVKGGEVTCEDWCGTQAKCSCPNCIDECEDACDLEDGSENCSTDCCIENIAPCC